MSMINHSPAQPGVAQTAMFRACLPVRAAHPTKTSMLGGYLPVRTAHPTKTTKTLSLRRVRRAHRSATGVKRSTKQSGFTLVEMLIALGLSAILFAGLDGVIGLGLASYQTTTDKNELTRQARFAMDQMVNAVNRGPRLMLPLPDNPNTNWSEHIREERIPATTPTDDSLKYTAVLALTIDPTQDLDSNGIADADDDGDGLIDEDPGGDVSYDNAAGIYLIDDDGDGFVDEGVGYWDDDEEGGSWDEDGVNGIDDDGDGNIDEDSYLDMNGDGCPGLCGIDENSNGSIDEGSSWDDDEDGQSDEDFYNLVVFYLDNGTLMQRTFVPWDISGGGIVSGLDFITSPIAENVTLFRVERVVQTGRDQVVDLTLELTSPDNSASVSLNTRVRVGGAL